MQDDTVASTITITKDDVVRLAMGLIHDCPFSDDRADVYIAAINDFTLQLSKYVPHSDNSKATSGSQE